jgi:uncharacterized protein YegJ (DUF2314 family)
MRTLLCLILLFSSFGCSRHSDDRIVGVKAEDPEMNTAIAEAQKTISIFWTAFDKPASDESEFFLKLAITDGKEVEHFWIGNIRKEKNTISGIVANDAELVSNVKFGQKILIDEKKISDWKFMKGGVTKGGYTIAVLLPRISKEEASEVKKQLGWK